MTTTAPMGPMAVVSFSSLRNGVSDDHSDGADDDGHRGDSLAATKVHAASEARKKCTFWQEDALGYWSGRAARAFMRSVCATFLSPSDKRNHQVAVWR